MVSKLDKTLQNGVTKLIDAHKSTILGTAEDIITDLNSGALKPTSRTLDETEQDLGPNVDIQSGAALRDLRKHRLKDILIKMNFLVVLMSLLRQ